jgi:hypothetical protein
LIIGGDNVVEAKAQHGFLVFVLTGILTQQEEKQRSLYLVIETDVASTAE